MTSSDWSGEDWIARLRRNSLLFVHWRIAAESVAPLLPAGAELDMFDGAAWLSLGLSRVTGARPRGVPGFLSFPPYLEAEARVPVRAGGRPGLWFLGLETTARVMDLAGRFVMHLPYSRGPISITARADATVDVRSRFLAGRYRVGTGEPAVAASGSLDAFLVDRARMFVETGAGLRRGEERNDEGWMLQPVQVELDAVTLPAAWGLPVGLQPDAAGFVAAVDSRYSRLLPLA